ncbi:ABC transporter ATP-binding protein [Rothia amarae]|uniref:ABC transporter ATP-binding protein n=1 Tax=Rothia amarae TaxID=169480 RepID=UPI0031D1797D
MNTPALTIANAFKTYPGASEPTLHDVSLDLNPGEAFVILGHTGSGKSTLLRAVAGLEELDSGSVHVAPGTRHAVVFQQAALFPWLTVRENIALGAQYKKNARRVDAPTVNRLIERLGLQGLEDRKVNEISGGQAQRVSIGRALAIQPSLLLLDEPFSALDPATRSELQGWLRSLIEELNLTVLMVSHDISEALTVGDRIGFFRAQQGFTRFWSPAHEQVTHEEILEYYRNDGDSDRATFSGSLRDESAKDLPDKPAHSPTF